ncbi:hypothetical protein [Paraburkholderia sp.]|uniref:hypothetical protein n=1 Tax=Paraburkholderia sp. TaxID=1926495 RepID=UPI0025E638DC|nr:hypothetical protein [Paraburkholderia sp.]
MRPDALSAVMSSAILIGMVLFCLFTARRSWKRQRTLSWCSLGASALIAVFASGKPDPAVTNKIFLLTAIAVGLQIVYDTYQQQNVSK